MDLLQEITRQREADAIQRRMIVPERELALAATGRRHHSLPDKLRGGGVPGFIAEMKQASPSAGLLIKDYAPAEIGIAYQSAGAAALSVLTEPHHFRGAGEHLAQVRAVCRLPLLRKDFISIPYQIYEAAAWGADIILLIMAALEDKQVEELAACAGELGLDVLAESHDEHELERALRLPAAMIGINSRNLKTLKTDLATAYRLRKLVPEGRLTVAESGIKTPDDIAGLSAGGYDAFLIGESLLRDGDPGGALRLLRGVS